MAHTHFQQSYQLTKSDTFFEQQAQSLWAKLPVPAYDITNEPIRTFLSQIYVTDPPYILLQQRKPNWTYFWQFSKIHMLKFLSSQANYGTSDILIHITITWLIREFVFGTLKWKKKKKRGAFFLMFYIHQFSISPQKLHEVYIWKKIYTHAAE